MKLKIVVKTSEIQTSHALGTYGRGSSTVLTGNKTAVCGQSFHCQRRNIVLGYTKSVNEEEEWET